MVSPVPPLPDSERRTSYTASAQTGPFNVGFPLYGDGTDASAWVQVWLNGVLQLATAYTVTSPSGPLGSIPLPIIDAQITFLSAVTGTIQIEGAQRPRRLSQLAEGVGVSAHDFNLIVTTFFAELRERWDRFSRILHAPPGETLSVLPPAATRASQNAGFDAFGNLTPQLPITNTVPVSAAMQPVLAASTLTIARTLLGAPVSAALQAFVAAATIPSARSLLGVPVQIFDTVSAATAASIDASLNSIRVNANGGAQFNRSTVTNIVGGFQSADGAWWAPAAGPYQAASPLHSQEFGWNFPGAGNVTVATAGNGWMVRTGFGSLWVGVVTVPCVQRIEPITGTVIATINTGMVAGSNEIRGLCMAFGSVWAVDRLGGKVYRINPATNAIDTTITGFTAPGGGAQGPFGICADPNNIYVTTTLTGASTIDKINPALVTGTTVTRAACLVASLNLGCDDTHVPSWDGDASIWVPCISSAALLFQVNAAAMTLTAAKATGAGGAWGTFSNGVLLFFTEISNDTFAYFPVKGGSGVRFSLPATSGAADIQQWGDDLYIALSTFSTNGAVGVYDARYFTQKGVISALGTHASSITFYGGDMWNVDSQSQRLQRTRISHRWQN